MCHLNQHFRDNNNNNKHYIYGPTTQPWHFYLLMQVNRVVPMTQNTNGIQYPKVWFSNISTAELELGWGLGH